jgi:hypothetical protein
MSIRVVCDRYLQEMIQVVSQNVKDQWRKHTFTAIGPNKIRSLERLRDFFAVQLLDQFCQHVVIVLFKRFEFGVQLDGGPILFKVTA